MENETVGHYHHYIPTNGSVTIKVERHTKGQHTWEIRIERPIQASASETGIHIVGQIKDIEREIKWQLGLQEKAEATE